MRKKLISIVSKIVTNHFNTRSVITFKVNPQEEIESGIRNSKADDQKIKIGFSSSDTLRTIVNQINANVEKYIKKHGLRFDSQDLMFALREITTNAYCAIIEKYLAQDENFEGKVTLDMFMSGEYFCIKIDDNGTGIDKNIESKIYDMDFSTKKNGIRTKGKIFQMPGHMGLGMSVILKDTEKTGFEFDLINNGKNQGVSVVLKAQIKQNNAEKYIHDARSLAAYEEIIDATDEIATIAFFNPTTGQLLLDTDVDRGHIDSAVDFEILDRNNELSEGWYAHVIGLYKGNFSIFPSGQFDPAKGSDYQEFLYVLKECFGDIVR